MSDIAIRVENLGKMYRIGGSQERYQTFRDAITRTLAAPFVRVRDIVRGQSASDLKEEIWALRDVSFEVKQGEVVGIIGRNGAGKSTLLKILSRITEPTIGYADVYGKVGALLEVGTGFHPELTGRENIYLNGAILGMSRTEITSKFDEIVDFAGVERFVDTPVKHYSSGMGLRLGFAVAAYLEPEILVVDEVLAVGDAEFQKKCLGKMEDVAKTGNTVLFVSHNMAAVKTLCQTGILLDKGQISTTGVIGDVIYKYMKTFSNAADTSGDTHEEFTFTNILLNGHPPAMIDLTRPLDVQVSFQARASFSGCLFYCIVHDIDNNTVIHARSDDVVGLREIQPGDHSFCVSFPAMWLRPGIYTLNLKLIARSTNSQDRFVSDPLVLEVGGNSHPGAMPGLITPLAEWHF
ncbi:MAG: polysaccharide ABC transporter ATP-binding protein [Anaerolineae bacterium]|nr:polysaccharide ABC transporter ATP-binding protein [Anaerolineae bacterium]NUQ07296.1 ATP-binding cassette domain-containing protein [Anaerolineae bacterium]